MRGEQQLAVELYRLFEEKCELLEKVWLVQKQRDGLMSSLKDASSIKAQTFEAACEELKISSSKLKEVLLRTDQIEEKSKHAKQVECGNVKNEKSPEDESKSLKSKVATAKTKLEYFKSMKPI
jgi:hypothetical protein